MNGFIDIWVEALVTIAQATGIIIAALASIVLAIWLHTKIAYLLYERDYGTVLFVGYHAVLWTIGTLTGAYFSYAAKTGHAVIVAETTIFIVALTVAIAFAGELTYEYCGVISNHAEASDDG